MTRLVAAISLILAFLVAPAFAQERGTPDEAKALAEKAAVFFEENGLEASHDAFDDQNGPWFDRDLYVFVYALDGTNLILASKPQLEGQNLMELKDAEGKNIIKEFVQVEDRGWVEYKWPNPVNNKIEDKASWIIRLGDYVLGVGAYK